MKKAIALLLALLLAGSMFALAAHAQDSPAMQEPVSMQAKRAGQRYTLEVNVQLPAVGALRYQWYLVERQLVAESEQPNAAIAEVEVLVPLVGETYARLTRRAAAEANSLAGYYTYTCRVWVEDSEGTVLAEYWTRPANVYVFHGILDGIIVCLWAIFSEPRPFADVFSDLLSILRRVFPVAWGGYAQTVKLWFQSLL